MLRVRLCTITQHVSMAFNDNGTVNSGTSCGRQLGIMGRLLLERCWRRRLRIMIRVPGNDTQWWRSQNQRTYNWTTLCWAFTQGRLLFRATSDYCFGRSGRNLRQKIDISKLANYDTETPAPAVHGGKQISLGSLSVERDSTKLGFSNYLLEFLVHVGLTSSCHWPVCTIWYVYILDVYNFCVYVFWLPLHRV